MPPESFSDYVKRMRPDGATHEERQVLRHAYQVSYGPAPEANRDWSRWVWAVVVAVVIVVGWLLLTGSALAARIGSVRLVWA